MGHAGEHPAAPARYHSDEEARKPEGLDAFDLSTSSIKEMLDKLRGSLGNEVCLDVMHSCSSVSTLYTCPVAQTAFGHANSPSRAFLEQPKARM